MSRDPSPPFVSSPYKNEGESWMIPQGRNLSTLMTSTRGPENGMEERRNAERSEEVTELRREVGGLRGLLGRWEADVVRLRREEEELRRECERMGDRVIGLEHEIGRMRAFYQEVVDEQTRQTRAAEERLKQTENLLTTRSAELSGAQTFLSTADGLSETEVLSVVRDLNENIYQVAVKLTEEWEKLASSQVTTPTDTDPAALSHLPILVQLVRNRDPRA